MNASAIYSKSGKGVQEASGKTSHLQRSDRAVLSAIDGRATLAEVAQKVGKTFDATFEKLIGELDKAGFIRAVSAGTPGAASPAAAAPGKPAGAAAPKDDLDFTTIISGKTRAQPPPQAAPRPAAPPPRPAATIPPPPPPPTADEKAKAERAAREQQDAFIRAREEAEKKAQAERDRIKAEAEAKMRAENEAKLRIQAKEEADKRFAAELQAKAKEAERKAAAEAEAKINAAREAAVKAAAEAKAKAEAEARKAREEAERARKEAEEKAERVRKEAEDKLRREQEEMKRKLEEERKAREEAERKAREEAKRLEEERRKLEEERKRREEEIRREEEERAARRKREEEEEQERRRKKREAEEEEERRAAAERAERRKREQEEEERERAERDARRRATEAEEESARAAAKAAEAAAKADEISLPSLSLPSSPPPPPPPAPEPAKTTAGSGAGFSDSLLADLESFNTREETEQKEKEEAERKAKEEAARRAREAEERRQKEEAVRMEREAKEQRKREEAERKAREETELREREEREKQRLKDEEEKRKQEAEERAKKAKQEERLAARAERGPAFSEEAALRSRRERELAAKPRSAAARAERKGWGKPIAIVLFLLLLVGFGVVHVMPIDTTDYERAATDALGRPVKIGSARLSLVTGPQVKLFDVSLGEGVVIAELRAVPELDSITGPRKAFSRIEIDRLKVPQDTLGPALFAKLKADNLSVGRIVLKNPEFPGPLVLPKGLEIDVVYDADGMVRAAQVRGPDALLAKLLRKDAGLEVDLSAASFSMPFAPEITLSKFSMKGTATAQGLNVAEWDGGLLNGTVSGTANVRWGDTWVVDGVVTARNIYAAVFAPALLSDGKAEGSGKFSMRGAPGKLAEGGRIDGSFTVTRGVLGSIDLSRAIQTGGKQATGRTQFNEMSGQVSYDRGAVALRSVAISAGQLNAGALVDIAPNGALSGRIVADVKVAAQHLRATLNLAGSVKDPQVKN
jgi:hypothetical protein